MLFFLLLIVLFASVHEGHSTDSNRCADIPIAVPDAPCPQGKMKCPQFNTSLEWGDYGYGCPIEIACENMWFNRTDPEKTCMRSCWDITCPYGEIEIPGGMVDSVSANGGFGWKGGWCDRVQVFCAKFPEYPGTANLMDWADLGFHLTNVDEEAKIVWPGSCGTDEIWCHKGFNDEGHWLGSWCAKDATECENEIERMDTATAR